MSCILQSTEKRLVTNHSYLSSEANTHKQRLAAHISHKTPTYLEDDKLEAYQKKGVTPAWHYTSDADSRMRSCIQEGKCPQLSACRSQKPADVTQPQQEEDRSPSGSHKSQTPACLLETNLLPTNFSPRSRTTYIIKDDLCVRPGEPPTLGNPKNTLTLTTA